MRRRLLGIATLVPPVYLLAFVGTGVVVVARGGGEDPLGGIPFGVLFAVHGAVIVLALGVIAVLVVHVVRAEALPDAERVAWVLALVFAGMLVAPAYWWLHVRPGPSQRGWPAPRAEDRLDAVATAPSATDR